MSLGKAQNATGNNYGSGAGPPKRRDHGNKRHDHEDRDVRLNEPDREKKRNIIQNGKPSLEANTNDMNTVHKLTHSHSVSRLP